jgi:hypothetical protein
MDALLAGANWQSDGGRSMGILVGAAVRPTARVEVEYLSSDGARLRVETMRLNGGYFTVARPIPWNSVEERVIALDAQGRVLTSTTCASTSLITSIQSPDYVGTASCSWDLGHALRK